MIRKNTNISLVVNNIFNKMAKRPLLIPSVFLLLELLISIKFYSILPILVLICLSVFCLFSKRFRVLRFSLVLLIVISIVSSASVLNVFIKYRDTNEYDVTFDGVIESVKYELDGSIRYIVNSSEYGRITLELSDGTSFCSGDLVRFSGNLKKPEKPTNPGEFDYGKYLKNQGINYTLFLKSYEIIKESIFGRKTSSLQRYFFNVRKKVVEVFDEEQGIAASVFLGDSSLISSIDRNSFQKVGCSHLLAVSGTHFSGFLALLPYLFEKLEVKGRTRGVFYAFFCLGIGCLTGWSPSVTRAAIMSIVSFSFRDSLSGMALASIVLLISNPFNSISNAFLMSFSCSISIKMFSRKISSLFENKGVSRSVSGTLSVMLSSQIGIIPFWQTTGAYISPLNFVAQLLETAIASIACMMFVPIILLSLIISNKLSIPLTFMLQIMKGLAGVFGDIPTIVVDSRLLGNSITFSVLLVVLYVFINPGIIKRMLSYLMLVILAVSLSNFVYHYANKPEAIIVFIDVEQGDACLVISDGRSVLIDGGVYEEGQKSVEAVLDYYSIDVVDVACFTHWDQDHAGGIAALYNDNRVNLLCTSYSGMSENVIEFITGNFDLKMPVEDFLDKSIILISEGDKISVSDTTYLNCISPSQAFDGENEDSVVFELYSGDFSCLLTGDISAETEYSLISGNNLQNYDLLKVAHHGSKYSSTNEFLDSIDVSYAVISVGENNSYGHPSKEVLERLEIHEITTLETSSCGAVQIAVFCRSWSISTYI